MLKAAQLYKYFLVDRNFNFHLKIRIAKDLKNENKFRELRRPSFQLKIE
jgi:hypothetical protein